MARSEMGMGLVVVQENLQDLMTFNSSVSDKLLGYDGCMARNTC